jgi:hypothetical protein
VEGGADADPDRVRRASFGGATGTDPTIGAVATITPDTR